LQEAGRALPAPEPEFQRTLEELSRQVRDLSAHARSPVVLMDRSGSNGSNAGTIIVVLSTGAVLTYGYLKWTRLSLWDVLPATRRTLSALHEGFSSRLQALQVNYSVTL
jgi:hypothetical protein